ncbi:10822_t:CDS:2, partial [Racocetra persica]
IKEEKINEYLMFTIIEKARQPFIQQSIQQPILFPQQPIFQQPPIDDKNELYNLGKQKLYEKIFNKIEREEKISDLIENNKIDRLIKDSDLIYQQKTILQNNRNRRLNLLQ